MNNCFGQQYFDSLVLFMGFVDHEKNIDFHQTYPLVAATAKLQIK